MIHAVGASCSHSRSERELGNGFPGASCSRSNQLSMLADRNFLASIQFALRRSQYQTQKPAGVSGTLPHLREERSSCHHAYRFSPRAPKRVPRHFRASSLRLSSSRDFKLRARCCSRSRSPFC